MASLVDRVLPMLSQSITLSSKLFSLRTSDVVSISVQNAPSLVSFPAVSPPPPLIYCGRGDKKTAKGKRFRHSFGNARPRNKKKGRGPPRPPMPSSPSKKDRSGDDDC